MILSVLKRFTSKKAAVLLSGCGHLDGSETHETVSIAISLSKLNYEYTCFAPNKSQSVYDHITGQPTDIKRNAMIESARLGQASITPLSELKVKDFDALLIPGGGGVVQTLMNISEDLWKIDEEVSKVLKDFFLNRKPIGTCCFATLLLARQFGTSTGGTGLDITMGKKGEEWKYSSMITKASNFGNHLIDCDVGDVCKDRFHKVVSTPAYLKSTAKPHEILDGIEKMVKACISLVNS